MTTKEPIVIADTIVSVSVKKENQTTNKTEEHKILQSVDENMKRPRILPGETYKLNTPLSKHSIYITINNVTLNEGTPYVSIQPLEMFFNSRDMNNFQWITTVTRLISAIFRKGGDITFIIKELKSIHDPNGGYFNKGKWVPSLVAEIGDIIEEHFIKYGVITKEVDPHMEQFIADKKAALGVSEDTGFPENATLCPTCQHKAVVIKDGCGTCLNCGDSKCG